MILSEPYEAALRPISSIICDCLERCGAGVVEEALTPQEKFPIFFRRRRGTFVERKG